MWKDIPCSRLFLFALALSMPLLAGCPSGSDSGPREQFISLGTAPVGGAFYVVGNAITEVLNDHKGENNWKLQPKGTKGSQENIRRLDQGKLELALSNAAITYFAVRGESGWEKPYEMRAVATMAPNVALFITKESSGVRTIADLKGKSVSIGPAGAGFEMFVTPILAEHGLSMTDINAISSTQTEAVDQLGDGTIDAAFLGGAIPTSSISQAVTSHKIFFIPFEEAARQRLIEKYPFFHAATIPMTNAEGNATYTGMTEDYQGLNVGSMHLITAASVDEELIYNVTKTLWENREELGKKHPAGKSLEKNATRNTGTEFHPGAIRAYKELGIWPEDGTKTPASPPAAEEPAPTEEPAVTEEAPPAPAAEEPKPETETPPAPTAQEPAPVTEPAPAEETPAEEPAPEAETPPKPAADEPAPAEEPAAAEEAPAEETPAPPAE